MKDVVAYLSAAMFDKPPAGSEVYCICTGRTTSLLQLADTLAEVLGTKPDIKFGEERKGDIRTSFGNPAKLQAKFGFSADTTLKDGLVGMDIKA